MDDIFGFVWTVIPLSIPVILIGLLLFILGARLVAKNKSNIGWVLQGLGCVSSVGMLFLLGLALWIGSQF